MRRLSATLLLLIIPATTQGGGWQLIAPRNVHQSGKLATGMAESSGAAVSRRNPGIIWTINDSGNPADLIATDTTGRFRGSFALEGAKNVDWEEVALGPCGTRSCIYIADTGDNLENRSGVQLYRVAEPTVPTTGVVPPGVPTTGVETLQFRYPDGPHDVEAMTVTAAGDVLLVTKGRSHGVIEFRIRATAWGSQSPALAERVDSLPIAASSGSGQLVTGMALSPDGEHAVVRTYRELFLFSVLPDGTMRPQGKPTSCDVLGLEPQGEGIAFLDDRRLVMTSERGLFKVGTVFVMECG